MKNANALANNRGISVVWILPLLAVCICAWILYTSYQNAGITITVHFDDATGIVPGKTQVIAKGIPIGLVKKIEPDLAKRQVVASIEMDKLVEPFLVEDTLFWVVRPQLSTTAIEGLDTILSGSYITAQPGVSETPSRAFTGLASPPPISQETPGLHLRLRAEKLGSIQVGTRIYYRNIEIGVVKAHQLEEDDSVLIDFFVYEEFANLVRQGSRFCNASGIHISGKLPNVQIQVESLAALIRGGILLHTPEPLKDSPAVVNGHIFKLYANFEAANYGIPMTLTLASGKDIIEGSTKVMYRGLEAGFVKNITFNDDSRRTVNAHILLDPRAELILRENTKFWIEKPQVTAAGIKNLGLLLSGAFITFQPGDGAFKDSFEILPDPPPQNPLRPGKYFTLVAQDQNQIGVESPVYFKNIQVGEVINVDLTPSARTVRTTVFIYQPYLHLLSTTSIFWIKSGIGLKASLQEGITMESGPLASLLRGGISFTSPEKLQKKKNKAPSEGHEFTLFSSYGDAVKATPALHEKGKIVEITAEDANSFTINAPLFHKSIRIGKIIDIRFSKGGKKIVAEVLVKEEFSHLITEHTKFYDISGLRVSGGLNGIEVETRPMLSILAGGIACTEIPDAEPNPPGKPFPLYSSIEAVQKQTQTELRLIIPPDGGLQQGAPILYKGVEIGEITDLELGKDLKTVIAKGLVKKATDELFRENSKLWVSDVEISVTGIRNPRTIFFGSQIEVLPGDGPKRRNFIVAAKPPHREISNSLGLGVVLTTSHLGSLSPSSPVYYREIQVGEVTDFALSPTFQKVHVHIVIYDRYRQLIRQNTRFWNISGAQIEGGIFSGIKVRTGSLQSILKGGIALATPDNEKSEPSAKAGDVFELYEDPKKEWLDWSPDVILFELDESQSKLLEMVQ